MSPTFITNPFFRYYLLHIICLSTVLFVGQTVVISRMQKLSKEGLQRTDKRIGLMNEILAAMDTVKYASFREGLLQKLFNSIWQFKKRYFWPSVLPWCRCYAWENSFQAKVQSVRNDELSWFRKASLLGAVWHQTLWKDSHFVTICNKKAKYAIRIWDNVIEMLSRNIIFTILFI